MKEINTLIKELVMYAKQNLYLQEEDEIYLTNILLHRLNVRYPSEETITTVRDINSIMDDILDYAVQNNLTTEKEKTLFETELIGIVTPLPSKIREMFNKDKQVDSKIATDKFFKFCKDSNYIRTRDIAKNIKWETSGSNGDIQITINLSKPEKDPKDILKAKLDKSKKYPSCMLCKENEGFSGTYNLPARQTLRIIPITLNNEQWNLQYSPYMYFDEHCIAFSNEHRPMKVNASTFNAMLDFVEQFPHYFIGSNAALPIVGGSILSHDHYQGGAKVLPMFKRNTMLNFKSAKYPSVNIGIVDWYNSVVRISSTNRAELQQVANEISDKWFSYTDESVGIIASDSEQHNAITPITTLDNGVYTLNFILRNNRTDSAHPFGIFHPAEHLHNIKKEGIGIIEVMGLFILPGRLLSEMNAIKDYLTGNSDIDLTKLTEEDALFKHINMIDILADKLNGNKDENVVANAIMDYINNACQEILYTTGVFKKTAEGQQAFVRFINSLGYTQQ